MLLACFSSTANRVQVLRKVVFTRKAIQFSRALSASLPASFRHTRADGNSPIPIGSFRHFTRVSTTSILPQLNLSRSVFNMVNRKPFERLPTAVIPTNYALKLMPNLGEFNFQGEQIISLEVKQETNKIVMNAADVQVNNVKFSGQCQEFSSEIQTELCAEKETVTFTFPCPLKAGAASLNMAFTGQLNDKMKGFYRSKYFGPDGDERYAAVTQFEATDARRAFPCWDEPAVKATFDVTLVVPKDLVAISNMPELKCCALDSDPCFRVVTFQRSPVMSTYLLAFIVGEFDYVEGQDADGVQVRVFTPVGKREQGQYALEVAAKTLPFYKDYFNIAYPLPKIDLIAIADFSAGAMENWGLVTYRESALLIDPINSSSSARQWVALVVGHELAHQWFGNLVTMEWWTHLWLNEGFASWIEYLCVDFCFPEFDIWTQFASNDFTRALDLDALKNSHPIEVPVGHPDEVDEIFDAISYSKGASVIRMLHDWIGDKSFRVGMHQYLDKHKYSNTFTEDLWAALEEASGNPVRKVMDTWTTQMGFPILKVSETVEGSTRHLTVEQEKFCADGGSCAGDSDSTWLVPFTLCTQKSPEKVVFKDLLHNKQAKFTVKDTGSWVKLNVGGVGFYRTCYSPAMLEELLPAIRDRSLAPRDRLGLQNDLFALARAGQASTLDALKLAEAFSAENNYTVWADLTSSLMDVSLLVQYTNSISAFKAFLHKLYTPIGQQLGWEAVSGESPLDAMLRGLVLTRLGRAGDQATIDEARKRFAAHCDKSATIPADLRSAVYATVTSNGGAEEYDMLLQLYDDADMQEERDRVMRILGTSDKPELIKRTLEFAMSDKVRSQDTVFVIGACASSKVGREITWQFVKDNWATLHDRYQGGFLLSRLVKSTTDGFASEDKAQEVDKFFQVHPAPAAERTIQQSLENIRLNEKQLSRDGAAIEAFLAAY